ncbi:restriction endonuclease subunit S [Phocaeicola plebeius]|uniref:restriction endonuclease subunit S n=1 Tax=Phocaeicola plebeius TaxID=310297 RepID=UPI003520DE76
MDTKKLRQKILDLAIRGKLVPQDPNDEPASVLLERIKAEKERLIKEGKIKRSKKTAKTSDTPHYENVPFEVPKGWVWTTLPELCTIPITDGTHKTPTYTDKEHGVPFISSKDVTSQRINWNNIKYITRELHEELHKRIAPQKNDILLAKNGTTGVAAIVEDTRVFDIYVTLAVIRPSQNICPQYLYQVINSNFCKEQFNSRLTGIGLPNLHLVDIKKTMIPLPPISEQKRIVTEIERWFVWIEQIRQSKTDLQDVIKQTKSKILDLAIHGKLVPQDPSDEPASELLKHINPKAEITCDNAQYRKIPKNWCACKLVDICSFLSRGKSPKYSEEDKTYPVFAQKCNLKDGGVSLEQAKFLDPSTINKWNEVYKLQTGDILVNSTGTGTAGRTRLFNTNCLGNYPFVVPDSHVSVVRVLKSICPQYVYAYISSDSIQQYMEENLAGSTNQKELYIGVLENMHIFLPPLAEQYRIVAKIEKLFSSLDNIQKALEV